MGETQNNPSTHERNIVCEPSAWELTKQTCVAIDTKNLAWVHFPHKTHGALISPFFPIWFTSFHANHTGDYSLPVVVCFRVPLF